MKDLNLFSIIPYKNQLIKLENAKSAKAYYRHQTINLLTGRISDRTIFDWIKSFHDIKISSDIACPRVIHLFYELGFIVEQNFDSLPEETLLLIDIEYETFEETYVEKHKKIQLEKLSEPNWVEYENAFLEGYAELIKGNCYQFNLTYPYIYSFNKHYTPLDFIYSLWDKSELRGAFGSATYIPYLNKLLLSNSPECLFQFKENILSSMPIKGTLPLKNEDNWKNVWKKLSQDKKSQAELYMISDLLRNDLSRIELPAATIVKKKYPKLVPGLLHQYSQIEVGLSNDVSLWRVIEKVFPGGSITGAPKIRAMKLISHLENRNRGFYCGSTLICYKSMKSASINIRSSSVDFYAHQLIYQAGGGITLLSNVHEEFKEMTYKHNSFIDTLTL